MTQDDFWKLVDLFASNSRGKVQRTANNIDKHLKRLNGDDISDFAIHFAQFQNEANTIAILEAAFVIGCGHSNDGFMDFRRWIVLQGNREYARILKNPDCLGSYDRRADPIEHWYSEYDPCWAYEEVTGRPQSSYKIDVYPDAKSDARDDSILEVRYPKLWKRCRS